jgi:hypothetical protein
MPKAEALISALGRHDPITGGLLLCHFFRVALIERTPGQRSFFVGGSIFLGHHRMRSFGLTSSGHGQMVGLRWFLSYDRRRGNAIGLKSFWIWSEKQPPPRP